MTTALENMWVGTHKETGEQWVSSVGTKVWGRPGDVKNSLRYHEEEDSYDVTQVTLTPLAEEHIGERSLFCVLKKGWTEEEVIKGVKGALSLARDYE